MIHRLDRAKLPGAGHDGSVAGSLAATSSESLAAVLSRPNDRLLHGRSRRWRTGWRTGRRDVSDGVGLEAGVRINRLGEWLVRWLSGFNVRPDGRAPGPREDAAAHN